MAAPPACVADCPAEAREVADRMAAVLPIVADRRHGIDTLKEQCRRLYVIEHGSSGPSRRTTGNIVSRRQTRQMPGTLGMRPASASARLVGIAPRTR